jgi:MFS family permease
MKRLWVLIAVCFVDMICLMIIAPLLAPFARRYGAADWVIGLLFSGFAIAQLLSSPVWGRVSDHYGRRPAILAGLGGSMFAYLIFGFANGLWLRRVPSGQGAGRRATGVAQAYVADTMEPKRARQGAGMAVRRHQCGVSIGGDRRPRELLGPRRPGSWRRHWWPST